MVYFPNGVARGEMIIKQSIRMVTWLRAATAADYLHLYKAQILILGGGTSLQSLAMPEFFIPASQILAAHSLPPAQEPPDYDVTEPNRKMQPILAMLGSFRIHAHMRMAAATTLANHLTTVKEAFLSIYDVEISNQAIPNMGVVRAPLLLVRPSMVMFALR
jgi:hypothetical protein